MVAKVEQETKEIAAQAAAQLIKDGLGAIFDSLNDKLSLGRAQFIEGFERYCSHMYAKNTQIRTLHSKNAPVSLFDIYVESSFEVGEDFFDKERFSEKELVTNFVNGQRVIVKGNGGSGKTVFLKHLWVSLLKQKKEKIPVFVELRRLNDLQTINVKSFCRSELQAESVLTNGVFEKLCERGRFSFIFDGFDEVVRDKRRIVERQIIELADSYRDCSFLVSGREDDRFSSWSDFEVYTVAPLSIEEVRELIEKIRFDTKVKKKFLEALDEDFYQQHKSFLSSPLLAVMMLMTFNENATIPSKLTGFYDSAFQTLLTWHDATKDSFQRDRALSVDEFRVVFSTFALLSYYDSVLEFNDSELRKYIGKALRYHKFLAEIEDVRLDFCESVNLLQRDGLKYVFVHRSFQEYFAAECAMHVVSGKAEKFLDVFSKRLRDNVFLMCFELHPELTFDAYFEPRVSRFHEFHDKLKLAKTGVEFLGDIYSEVRYEFLVRESVSGLMNIEFQPAHDASGMLDFIDACQRLRSDWPYGSAVSVMHKIFYDFLRSAIRKAAPQNSTEIVVRISISFEDGNFKLSVRNIGQEKLAIDQVASIRSDFLDSSDVLFNQIRTDVGEIFQAIGNFVGELEKDREEKSASIDDILGLA
ncbi:hypothetical protein roselon_01256 [Roseibacterium elongatum DSM 19469]|uniref:NACHT domain-containing protein n=1 Tax=Roseicyclus elongatus DSM 19469 TaxID=1294273 RepID=W8S4C9_9RHOB|nr:NACHT domain-containing protein [Roseibacterium elongatum]AHM03646.1 hypothetical protein roselon_01256 [Roseibacterium elongatum DSM 19469]